MRVVRDTRRRLECRQGTSAFRRQPARSWT
jgi:hypothetical protein